MKKLLMLAILGSLVSTHHLAWASRSYTVAPIYVHFIVHPSPWCTKSQGTLDQRYSVGLTNISNVTQTITVTANLLTHWAQPDSSSTPLGVDALGGGAVVTPYSQNLTLAAHQSSQVLFGLSWYGTLGSQTGTTHIISSYVITISINEDQGALLGSYSIDLDNHCANMDDYTSNTADDLYGVIRNTSKTFFINGGRPF